jgi:hypothetical protein
MFPFINPSIMKKASIVVFILFLATTFNVLAQESAVTDYFAGKWELTLIGLPEGDAILIAHLDRAEGKLTGVLAGPDNSEATRMKLTTITETENRIELFFQAQGFDVSIDLSRVDEDNMKGALVGMYDVKAKRIREQKAE